MVSTRGIEPALTRLDEIEVELSRLLTTNALFPLQRRETAQRIVALCREGQQISFEAEQYRPPEPWAIADPHLRQDAVRYIVGNVFRDAPAPDVLTDALVDHWNVRLLEAAEQQDHREYEKQSRQMRQDADTARRSKSLPCPFDDPKPPDDPTILLQHLAVLTGHIRTKLVSKRKRSTDTWDRAGRQALDTLEASINWVGQQHSDGGSEPGRTAMAEQAVDLARQFNEIRHAIGQRCLS